MDDPVILMQRFALPQVIAIIWALLVVRWIRPGNESGASDGAADETTDQRQARWTWPGVAVALLLAQPPGLEQIEVWPWTMPGISSALFVVLVAVAVLLPGRWQGRWRGDLVLGLALLVVSLPTYAWSNKGVWGWLLWASIPAASLALAAGARRFVADRPWRAVWLWAPLFAAAPVIAFSHANTSTPLVLVSLALAFGGAAIAGAWFGNNFLRRGMHILPAGMLVLLVANAQLRFVPAADQLAWQTWGLALAPLLLLAVPWVWWALSRSGSTGWRFVRGAALAAVLLVAAIGLPLAAYLYEGDAVADSDPGWDYGSFGQ